MNLGDWQEHIFGLTGIGRQFRCRALGGDITGGHATDTRTERQRRMLPRTGFGGTCAPPNKRMHATRDTKDFIFGQVVGGRVMRGVRRQCQHSL